MIISGLHGIGKSVALKVILENLGQKYVVINSSELKIYRQEMELTSIRSGGSNKLMGVDCLIIENTEMITLPAERKYLVNNLKNNHKKKYLPIVLINNGQYSKLFTDIKKLVYNIEFLIPSEIEIKSYIKKILLKEDIKFNVKYILGLIRFCRNDIRKILLTLEDLKDIFKNKEITKEDLSEFYNNNTQKKEEIGLFQSVEKILYKYNNMEEIINLYQLEKVMFPLTVHENISKKLENLKISNNEKIRLMGSINNRISYGDLIETSIYTDQNWYLKNLHTFYTCIYPSYHINKYKYNEHNRVIYFTQDLNRNCLKNINNKKFDEIKCILEGYNSNDIYNLSHIMYIYLKRCNESGDVSLLREFLEELPVKLDQRSFEAIIKINKIDFNSKDIDKKILKKLF